MRGTAHLAALLLGAALLMTGAGAASVASEGHDGKPKPESKAKSKAEKSKKPDERAPEQQADPREALAKCFQSLAGNAPKAVSAVQEPAGKGKPATVGEKAEGGEHVQEAAKQPANAPGPISASAEPPHAPAAAEGQGQPETAATQPRIEQPYELVRTLEAIQDKIAIGDSTASAFQRAFISEIARKLPQVTDDDWKKPKNSRAAIVYALSGGDPGVLTKLLSLGPLPCVDENLIKGLLDYSQGHNDQAWELLSKIDPRSLDPRAAGHLALAQAMLIAAKDGKKAMGYLDLARILSPGTLVEEAAIRRETVIAAAMQDYEMFQMLTSQYFRRFSKSVYADDFIQRFAVAVATSKYADDERLFADLSSTLDALPSEQRRSAYVAIAGAGIVRGRIRLTRLTAAKLADFAKTDPTLGLRAKLYEAAVSLVTDKYDEAIVQLKSIDAAKLPLRDQGLLRAALKLAAQMHMPPQVAAPAAMPPVSAEQGKDAELTQPPKIVAPAKEAINRADELLNGDRR
jgi:chemotaxis protein MotC